MSKILTAALERIAQAETETAMRPYKPKTGAQLRPKNDPAHRLMRQAYKRRTSGDKNRAHRLALIYRRKNAGQLKQRQKRSAQLHPNPMHRTTSAADDQTLGYWSYQYVWRDGLTYSLVLYGTRFGADCDAQRLGLQYGGELVDVILCDDTTLENIQKTLPLAARHESNSSKNLCTAYVYAGHPYTIAVVNKS
jgi:hypothetical protein